MNEEHRHVTTSPTTTHRFKACGARNLAVAVAGALLLLAPAALSKTTKTAAAAGDSIVLSNAGSGTTSKLRYTFKKGAISAWSVSIGSDMTIAGMPAMVMPRVVFESNVTIKSVSKTGTATCHFKLTRAVVKPAGKITAKALTTINKKLKALTGVTGEATVDSRGRLVQYKRKALSKKNAQLEVLLLNFDQAFGQITIPLPNEAVGKGATWVVDRKVVSNAISLRQKATYKLLKRGKPGGLHRIGVTVNQSAKPQKIQLPGMPPTLKTKLLRAEGSGNSKFSMLADRLGTDGTATTKLELAIEMQQGKQNGKAGVKLNTSIALKRTSKN